MMEFARDQAFAVLSEAKLSLDVDGKIKGLKRVIEIVVSRNPELLPEFLPHILEFQMESPAPLRRYVCEALEEIATNFPQLGSSLVPVLSALVQDPNSLVSKHAVIAGTALFKSCFERVLIEGLQEGADSVRPDLLNSWHAVCKLKDEVIAIVRTFNGRSDGVKLHSIKFLETMVLLYSPDPQCSPKDRNNLKGGSKPTANVAMIVNSHPVLEVASLSMESTKSVSLLLSLLRSPKAETLSSALAIVLINSLSSLARSRPLFFGRILPSLIGLAPSCSQFKSLQSQSIVHCLKLAFLALLKCQFPSALPWRQKLTVTLQEMRAGEAADTALRQIDKANTPSSPASNPYEAKPQMKSRDPRIADQPQKRSHEGDPTPSPFAASPKRIKTEYMPQMEPAPTPAYQNPPQMPPAPPPPTLERGSSPVEQMVDVLSQLVSQGENGVTSVGLLIDSLTPDLLADVVIACMYHLPESAAAASAMPTADPPTRDPRRREQQSEPAVKSESALAVLPAAQAPAARFPDPFASWGIVPAPLSEGARQQLRIQTQKRILENRVFDSRGALLFAGNLRIGIVARLAVEFPEEDEILERLREYILDNFVENRGHELAVAVLYQLFCHFPRNSRESLPEHARLALEIPQPLKRDFVSSYNAFFLSLTEALYEALPASDKSLSRLVCEAPHVPAGLFALLRTACQLDSAKPEPGLEVEAAEKLPPEADKDDSGERVNQALTILWNLLSQRPPLRAPCIEIILECAVHSKADVRQKAVRLIANRLFQLPFLSDRIEATAVAAFQKVREYSLQPETAGGLSLDEAQRLMALFLALCTKKHSLLHQLFGSYPHFPKLARQVLSQHLPVLIKAVGSSSPDMISIVGNPPEGSLPLVKKAVVCLVEHSPPSGALIAKVKLFFESRPKEPELLIPILPWLTKSEVLPLLPRLMEMPSDKFQLALNRILQGSVHSGPALSPSELLIALHKIDPSRDSVPLKKVMEVCNQCLASKSVFTQQVLAKALNQLVEHTPLPKLFMRTTIQALGNFPALRPFVVDVLSRLTNKQVWRDKQIWAGFVRCAALSSPDCFRVLIQLPAAQLEDFLRQIPDQKKKLAEFASQDSVKGNLPRATLSVLGLDGNGGVEVDPDVAAMES